MGTACCITFGSPTFETAVSTLLTVFGGRDKAGECYVLDLLATSVDDDSFTIDDLVARAIERRLSEHAHLHINPGPTAPSNFEFGQVSAPSSDLNCWYGFLEFSDYRVVEPIRVGLDRRDILFLALGDGDSVDITDKHLSGTEPLSGHYVLFAWRAQPGDPLKVTLNDELAKESHLRDLAELRA